VESAAVGKENKRKKEREGWADCCEKEEAKSAHRKRMEPRGRKEEMKTQQQL